LELTYDFNTDTSRMGTVASTKSDLEPDAHVLEHYYIFLECGGSTKYWGL